MKMSKTVVWIISPSNNEMWISDGRETSLIEEQCSCSVWGKGRQVLWCCAASAGMPIVKLKCWVDTSWWSRLLTCLCVCLSCRYVSDAGDSYRCRWPHLRQQRQAGVQHTSRTTLFFCGATDRYAWELNPILGHIYLSPGSSRLQGNSYLLSRKKGVKSGLLL